MLGTRKTRAGPSAALCLLLLTPHCMLTTLTTAADWLLRKHFLLRRTLLSLAATDLAQQLGSLLCRMKTCTVVFCLPPTLFLEMVFRELLSIVLTQWGSQMALTWKMDRDVTELRMQSLPRWTDGEFSSI